VDIRSLVYQIVDIFPGPLKTPARWVADRVFAVWDDISAVLRLARGAWLALWTTWHNWVWAVAAGFEQVLGTLTHLYRQYVPQWIQNATNDILRWVTDRINAILNELRDLQNGLTRWLHDRLAEVIDAFQRWRQFLLDAINETRDVLRDVAKRVATLLTDPNALVSWILASMVTALFHWVDDHFEQVAAYFWARREALLIKGIGRIEALLSRLL
jgi:hypothetical protein